MISSADSQTSNSTETGKRKNLFYITKTNNENKHKTVENYREGKWSIEEHKLFIEEMLKVGIKDWKKVKINIKELVRSEN